MIKQLSYKQTPVSTFCPIKLVDGIQIFTKCGLLLEDWPKMLVNKGLQTLSVFIDKHLNFHVHEHVLACTKCFIVYYSLLFIQNISPFLIGFQSPANSS